MDIEAILERIQVYYQAIRTRWWLLAVVGAIIGMITFLYIQSLPRRYEAVAVFHPDSSSGSSGISTLGSDPLSLIFGRGAASAGGNALQMIGVLQSRRISEDVAADSLVIEGEKVLMADYIRSAYPSSFSLKNWISSLFTEPGPPPSKERKVISVGRGLKANLEIESNDFGFIEARFWFNNPKVLEVIATAYINKLTSYYQSQKTEKAEENVFFFEYRSDSVKKEIDKASYSLARFLDKNKYRVNAVDDIYNQEKQLQIGLLSELYQQQMISLEQAKGQLQQDTPIIQVLDYPVPPYPSSAKSPLVFGLVGVFLGFIIASIFRVRRLLMEDFAFLKVYAWDQVLTSLKSDDTDNSEPATDP